MSIGTRYKIYFAIALLASLACGGLWYFAISKSEQPIGPLAKGEASAASPFAAEAVDVNTLPLLVTTQPVFTPPTLEKEDVLAEDRQALGVAMKAFIARVASSETRVRAAAILNQVAPPTGEDLARIKSAKELDEDEAIRTIQLKVADLNARETYYQDKISDLYYLNGSIAWEDYVAASWLNAERRCHDTTQQLGSDELTTYLGVATGAECMQMMRGVFTPPHPSELFVRFPDILQYRGEGRTKALVTEEELAQHVPLELVREVLRIDNEIARRKSELPTTIPSEQRITLAKALTKEFEVRARSMLGARGYEIIFGTDKKD